MTNEHTSLEKYTSHTLCERVVCERWVGDWTDCNILTPSSSVYSSTSFLILLGCPTGGPDGPSLLLGAGSQCLELQLELRPQLTPTMAPGYIIVWHPTASCRRRICTEFNPSTCQGDIFDRMRLFLDWRLGRSSICYTCSRDWTCNLPMFSTKRLRSITPCWTIQIEFWGLISLMFPSTYEFGLVSLTVYQTLWAI